MQSRASPGCWCLGLWGLVLRQHSSPSAPGLDVHFQLLRLGKGQECGGKGLLPGLDTLKAGILFKYLWSFASQPRAKLVFPKLHVE